MKALLAPLFLALPLFSFAAPAPADLTNFTFNSYKNANDTLTPNLATLTGYVAMSANVVDATSFEYNFTYDNAPAVSGFLISANRVALATLQVPVGSSGTTGWQTYNFATPFSGLLYYSVFNRTGVDSTQLLVRNLQDTATLAAVPEPETYAMLLAGLGLMGAVARRKSRRTSSPA